MPSREFLIRSLIAPHRASQSSTVTSQDEDEKARLKSPKTPAANLGCVPTAPLPLRSRAGSVEAALVADECFPQPVGRVRSSDGPVRDFCG